MIFHRKREWEIAAASYGGNQLVLLLAAGWEPFGATPSNDEFSTFPGIIWLRRPKEKSERTRNTSPGQDASDSSTD